MWPSEPMEFRLPAPLDDRCTVFGCGSSIVLVRIVPHHRHIGLYCAVGHWQHRWIPHEEFREGGAYAGVIPSIYIEQEKQLARPRSFSINERIRYEYLLQADGRCTFVILGRLMIPLIKRTYGSG